MAEKLSWEDIGESSNAVLSPAWAYKDLVFASGSLGSEADGSFSKSVERQTKLALQNLDKVLRAAGSSLDNTLKVVVFIKKPKDVNKVNSIYAKHLPHKPARSCFGVNFPNKKVLVEIEAIAFKNPKAKL
ncbi:DEKNAAC100422 [Brettanomyces naardenensis]|uniref:DEKNAAC100422 n=1 Tax=Brettanomyces naardenensis TaxID=13370 RepID=A0A448YGG4_BRENA|nr:DEKNAAC100422 [Brettanomyces naardenensis]